LIININLRLEYSSETFIFVNKRLS